MFTKLRIMYLQMGNQKEIKVSIKETEISNREKTVIVKTSTGIMGATIE